MVQAADGNKIKLNSGAGGWISMKDQSALSSVPLSLSPIKIREVPYRIPNLNFDMIIDPRVHSYFTYLPD